ncbi:MAG: HAD hydrolase family protein, partial [Anaeroplasmataceae bacterium]|nr:HAD hydrolase family protein [Anaeroplasmataceae bacterium]
AVFVAILTFLSVTLTPNINVGYWQWQFGTNRILSTIIGVLIALGVNLFRLPHRYKNKNLLFCVGIDGMLLKDSDRFRGFVQYKMNYLNRIGANVTLFTTRTPTTFMPLLEDVRITHPVVCMSGAALYDAVQQHYIAVETIDVETAEEVYQVLKKNNVSPFVNQIHEDVLFTYNESLDNDGERIYANDKKNAAYCSYVPGPAPKDEIVYFLIVEKEDVVIKLIHDIQSDNRLASKLSILVYDVFEPNQAPNLKYVKIYSKKIENLDILKKYCAEEGLDIVGFTSSNHANHLLKHSRIGVSLDSLDEEYRNYCTKLVPKENPENLFREVQRIYNYNLAKYGKKD